MDMKKQKRWMCCLLVLVWFWCGAGRTMAAGMPEAVLPGGMAFGVKFACEGLVVVGFTEVTTENGSCMPAYDAGLRMGDRIFAVNGSRVNTSEEFVQKIENSASPVEIQYERNGEECTTRFKPVYSREEGKYKTGMWIRDTTAGIGTVTFLLPETGEFVGLGHGICDQNTGELLPLGRGTVMDVSISGVSRGMAGRPGELMGYFTEDKVSGNLYAVSQSQAIQIVIGGVGDIQGSAGVDSQITQSAAALLGMDGTVQSDLNILQRGAGLFGGSQTAVDHHLAVQIAVGVKIASVHGNPGAVDGNRSIAGIVGIINVFIADHGNICRDGPGTQQF